MKKIMTVNGMSCNHCKMSVEKALGAVAGVESAVVDLVDIEKNEGRANPLGKNGDAVYDFFKEVIEECDGDKNLFTSIYQTKLGEDDPQIKLAYNKRKKSL